MRPASFVAIALVIASGLAAGAAPAATPVDGDVRAAIVASIRARMGDSATVEIEGLDVRRVLPASGVRAVPDAGSKVGGPMRFLLVDAGATDARRRVGSADATVRVSIVHVRAAGAIARGQVVEARDLVVAVDDVGRVPLERLPLMKEVVGAAARRDLRAGMLVMRNSIDLAPLVKSGDEVTTIVRVGAVEARGRAVATETAAMGEVVRVVANRRNLRGRVVGPGEVEIQK